jgi:hypothetical protein
MHEITLYTLDSRKVLSYDLGTVAFMHPWKTSRTKCLPDALIYARSEIEHLPVHWFSERFSDGSSNDYRFAIEPKLAEILISAVYQETQTTIKEQRQEIERRETGHTALLQRIEQFKAKPWYQRVWAAIKNSI